MHKHSKELSKRGLPELDYTFGDFFMPVVICGTAGAFGCLADGAAVLHSTAPPHMMNFVSCAVLSLDIPLCYLSCVTRKRSALANTRQSVLTLMRYKILRLPLQPQPNYGDDGYHNIAQLLLSGIEKVTHATNHPEILTTSDKFLRALGQGVMGAFIGELVGKGVEVPSERTGEAISMLVIDKEDSGITHPEILTSDKFLRALGLNIW